MRTPGGAWRRLYSLHFYHFENANDRVALESRELGNLVDGQVLLDERLQDRVQNTL